jgi:probable F420-dependent oxidoreductase
MRFGAVFPTTEIGDDPLAIRDYAQAAEALGFVRLTAYDHVLGASHADRDPPLAGPYDEHDAFHEPFVLFGFLAAHTTTIEMATGVLVLPQRQTALVAKQATEIDLLSGGRLVLGVGTGWNHVEYESLGTTFRDRARRLDDQIALLRALWSEPLVTHDSTFHHVTRAGLLPRPARSIPVWLGGSAPGALERSARLGDGHIFAGSADKHFAAAARLAELVEAAGRDPATFGTDMFVEYVEGPDIWHDRAARWAAQGGTLMSVRSMSSGSAFLGLSAAGLSGPAQHIAALEQFATEMIPAGEGTRA